MIIGYISACLIIALALKRIGAFIRGFRDGLAGRWSDDG
jgi:hypothetical protein